MWTYSQSTGQLRHDGTLKGGGYSGRNVPDGPQGRNNPDLESLPDVGPIPRGGYMIGDPIVVARHAPPVFALTPKGHDAHGRTSFLIHGNNVQNDASHGCIILDYPVRTAINESLQTDRAIEVTT
jgi:hypothetical protein